MKFILDDIDIQDKFQVKESKQKHNTNVPDLMVTMFSVFCLKGPQVTDITCACAILRALLANNTNFTKIVLYAVSNIHLQQQRRCMFSFTLPIVSVAVIRFFLRCVHILRTHFRIFRSTKLHMDENIQKQMLCLTWKSRLSSENLAKTCDYTITEK